MTKELNLAAFETYVFFGFFFFFYLRGAVIHVQRRHILDYRFVSEKQRITIFRKFQVSFNYKLIHIHVEIALAGKQKIKVRAFEPQNLVVGT